MRISDSDHSTVAQASPAAQGNAPEESVTAMGKQAMGMSDPVAIIPDLSFHPIHQFMMGQGSPA
jgi:hypothetical protein